MRRTVPLWCSLVVLAVVGAGCPTDPPVVDDDDDDAGGLIYGLDARLHEDIGSLVYATWVLAEACTGHVEYLVDEGQWRQAPQRDWSSGEQEQLLLGIPYGHEVSIRVECDFGDGPKTSDAIVTSTGPAPGAYQMPELIQGDPTRYEPTGHYLLGSVNVDGGWQAGNFWKFIHDREGRLVWAMLTPGEHWTLWTSVARSGDHLVWDELYEWPVEGQISQLHRMTLDGTILESVDAKGAHHAFAERADGTLIWASFGGLDGGEGEWILSAAPGGEPEVVFHCEPYMDSIGLPSSCAHNSLFWHEPSDSVLYSLYSHSSVLEVDLASGEVARAFGGIPGTYPFDPPESAFDWQHGVSYTGDGTLLVSTHVALNDFETVVREYEVQDDTLEEIWNFGVDGGLTSFTNGDAHRLPGGNTLHNIGDGGLVREITPAGEVVWELDWDGYYLLGRTILLDDLYDLIP